MGFINIGETSINSDFIVQNYIPIPIYVDKYEKDNKLKIRTYNPKYAFFAAFNNNLLKNIISSIPQNEIPYELNDLIPLISRINTDFNEFYDFINFYFLDYEHNLNFYIKKYYGSTDFYECNANSIDKNDLSILTKPINFCKNKKSILNKIYNFEGTKLITGYLSPNSFFDIYIGMSKLLLFLNEVIK